MTSKTPKLVIADASCLIVLSRIDAFPLLQHLYGSILTTPRVANEAGRPLPPWILEKEVQNQSILSDLELEVDRGEASAIALALEVGNCSIILDDDQGRRLAQRLKLDVTGTLGVLLRCKEVGLIQTVSPFINQLRAIGFRMSETLVQLVLRQADEL